MPPTEKTEGAGRATAKPRATTPRRRSAKAAPLAADASAKNEPAPRTAEPVRTPARQAEPPPVAAAPAPERAPAPAGISDAERRRLVAQKAYLKAARRGFRGNRAEQDWLEAEAEVNALLARDDKPAG